MVSCKRFAILIILEKIMLKTNLLFDIDDNFNRDRYTNVIPKIQYVPKTRCKPSEISLYNLEKYNNLVKYIKSKNLDSEIEKFLLYSATRHIVFNYQQIAEYYSHSDKEVQELMEKSGLVIIDFEDAMENGFVKLQKNIRGLYDEAIKK